MKKKNLFMALAAICAGFTFASCSNDIDDVAGPAGQLADPTRGVSMNITKVGTSEMTNVTRATATEVNKWATAPDKNIGVSVYSSAAGTEAMKTGSVNMKWTYNTSSEGWDAQTPLTMFPGDEGVVTAYYPYGESVDPKAIDIDGTKDYMYALIGDNKTVNYGSPQTSLLMHHANAQLRVNLVRKGYAGTGTISSFSVKGSKFASAGKLNSLTGVVSNHTMAPELTGINEGTLAADISATPEAKIEALYTWFVPVSDAAAPVTFDATIDGLKLRYTTSQQFLAGKRYTFNLAVTSSLQGELVLTSVDIDPWTNENNDGDLELDDDVSVLQSNSTITDVLKVAYKLLETAQSFQEYSSNPGLLITQYGRINRYNSSTWDIAGGKIPVAVKAELDDNEVFRSFSEVQTISLPNGETWDAPHFWAALNGMMKNTGDLCGWGGDLVEFAADVKSNSSISFPSLSFNAEDWKTDADAYNIYISGTSGTILDAIETYATSSLTENYRITKFLEGGSDISTRFNNSPNRLLLNVLMSQKGVNATDIANAAEKMQLYIDNNK